MVQKNLSVLQQFVFDLESTERGTDTDASYSFTNISSQEIQIKLVGDFPHTKRNIDKNILKE